MRLRLENLAVSATAPRKPCGMHFQLSNSVLRPAKIAVLKYETHYKISNKRRCCVHEKLGWYIVERVLLFILVPSVTISIIFHLTLVSFPFKQVPLITGNRRSSSSRHHVRSSDKLIEIRYHQPNCTLCKQNKSVALRYSRNKLSNYDNGAILHRYALGDNYADDVVRNTKYTACSPSFSCYRT